MKLTTLLLLIAVLQVSARTFSQKVTISGKGLSLSKIFRIINKQTGYEFIYDPQLLKTTVPVSIDVKDEPLTDVLKICFKNQRLTSFIKYNTIVIQEVPELRTIEPANTSVKPPAVIHGHITNEKGEPVEGANIIEKGSGNGTSTNGNGDFSISAITANATLIISSVGYETASIAVGGRSVVNLQMHIAVGVLEETVVIGYGTQKKTDVTGSASSVSSKSYKDQPVTDVASALQGRASGVSVSSNTGAPGGSVKIRIRGANSINSTNDPLYVVDGVALGSVGLQDLNVNDIASMEVLKDASSTAIYGSRGSNGVVLITTKGGQSSKSVIEYNTFLSYNNLPKKYDLLNASDYATQVNHIDGAATFPDPSSLGKGTDWQGLLYQTGKTQNHQLSISGGTEKSRYYISGYYVDQSGIIINTGQKKFAFRSNLDTKLNDKMSFGLNIFAAHSKANNNNDLGGGGSPALAALDWSPTESVYTSPGKYRINSFATIWSNPYMIAKERINDAFNNSAIVNGKFKYDITDWLSLNINLGLDYSNVKGAYLNNEWISPTSQGSGQYSVENYTLQHSDVLTFHKTFGKIHSLKATAVYEQTSNNSQAFTANGSGLSSTNFGYYNLGLNTAQSIGSDYSNWALQSYVGRLSYSLKDRYLVTATYRADGSSKFQKSNNKWGYFPSVGLGWRLSEEPFIAKLNIFSNLKLRGSYGVTGNQAISPYSSLGLLNGQQYSFGTRTIYQGYSLGNPQNANLKWESTYQSDFGLDFSVLNNRLNVSIDYFDKNTRDLLLKKTIPNYNGGGTQYVNIGEVNNRGFELSVNATAVTTARFSWNTFLSISALKNKVTSLGDQSIINVGETGNGFYNTNIQVVKVGEPLGAFYLIPWAGIYQARETAMGFVAGDNKYIDVSGNGSIGFEDRVVSGSAMPKFQWGFNNELSYKNLSLNLFIQGSNGNKIFNATYASAAIVTSDIKYPSLKESANYWTPSNPGSQWADPASRTNRSYVESTRFLQDGSYIRIKNISLSYTLSKKLLRLGEARLSFSGQNLFTITRYKGYDPESDSAGNNDAVAGIDYGAYPHPKTYTFSLNVKF